MNEPETIWNMDVEDVGKEWYATKARNVCAEAVERIQQTAEMFEEPVVIILKTGVDYLSMDGAITLKGGFHPYIMVSSVDATALLLKEDTVHAAITPDTLIGYLVSICEYNAEEYGQSEEDGAMVNNAFINDPWSMVAFIVDEAR